MILFLVLVLAHLQQALSRIFLLVVQIRLQMGQVAADLSLTMREFNEPLCFIVKIMHLLLTPSKILVIMTLD